MQAVTEMVMPDERKSTRNSGSNVRVAPRRGSGKKTTASSTQKLDADNDNDNNVMSDDDTISSERIDEMLVRQQTLKEIDRAKDPNRPRITVKQVVDILLPLLCLIVALVAYTELETVVNPDYNQADKVPTDTVYQLGSCPVAVKYPQMTYACFPNTSLSSGVVSDTNNGLLTVLENKTLPLCQVNNSAVFPATKFRVSDCVAPEYDRLSLGWKAAVSLIPFVCVFQGILSLKLSSRYVAPFTMCVTVLLGLNYFRDAKYFRGDATPTASGKVILIIIDRAFWTLFDYALNVFSAFFFLRVLQLWGVVESMRAEFDSITDRPNRKLLLVGFCFAITLGVVAPGGSNFVVAGSILISMNIYNLKEGSDERQSVNNGIATLALFGNALTSAFNLLGICIVTIAEDIGPLDAANTRTTQEQTVHGAKEIGRLFSEQFIVFATISPVIMCFLVCPADGWRAKFAAIAPDLWLLLGTGFVYSWIQLVIAWQVGPELPCLVAGGFAMVFMILVENRASLSFRLPTLASVKQRRYVLPLLLLTVVLLIWGVIPGMDDILTGEWGTSSDSTTRKIFNPKVLDINSGGTRFQRHFAWIQSSAMVVLVIGVITPWIVAYNEPSRDTLTGPGIETPFAESGSTSRKRFKHRARHVLLRLRYLNLWKYDEWRHRTHVIKRAAADAIEDVLPILFSITSFASIASLMSKFGMTQSIAEVIVKALDSIPNFYAFVMPWIGMLGSALTGSTTTANFLFARLQVNTAKDLGLVDFAKSGSNSIWEVGAINILGATGGEMISPMNAVVITMIDGVTSTESDVIRRLVPYSIVWMALVSLVSLTFIVPNGGLN